MENLYRQLIEENEMLRAQLTQSDLVILDLTKAINYMVGIAERGRGYELKPTEKVTTALLEYVKELEEKLTNSEAPIEDKTE